MFGQKPLTAAETMRLAVLGVLTQGDLSYADLAVAARRFVERLVGPSLDLLGSSLEVLRLEGLIEGRDGASGDAAIMTLTDAGHSAFETLMAAPLRAPLNDIQRLSLALKMRYLDGIAEDDRLDQMEMVLEIAESEIARLEDIADAAGPDVFSEWRAAELGRAQALRAMAAKALNGEVA
ncbi:MAG: hypothetical protein QNJ84_00225 [Alphaproteobacteria bacterium]|nr:hypothetical protein [Alphaproteobacteria bacterium]